MRTKYWDFYSGLIKPEGVLEKKDIKPWKINGEIWGASLSVSTFPTMPVKVGICKKGSGMGGADDGQEDKILFGMTTPAGRLYRAKGSCFFSSPYYLGAGAGGSSTAVIMLPEPIILVDEEIGLYVWAHNMDSIDQDFHSNIIIYWK